jgi:hypothetical protein
MIKGQNTVKSQQQNKSLNNVSNSYTGKILLIICAIILLLICIIGGFHTGNPFWLFMFMQSTGNL